MKLLPKEVTIAIILGFFIGVIITYGIWNANRTLKQKQQVISPEPTTTLDNDQNQNSQDQSNSLPTTHNSQLTLSQPEPHTLVHTDTTTVSGFTKPDSTVIIYLDQQHQIVYPDPQGQFSTQISLESGINYLSVVSLLPSGQQFKLDRTIVYSTTELE